MNAKETVKSYMDGIVADLFAAEQAYALLKQIGQNANAINQANFGALFGPLQSVLSNACFLSVAKLFAERNLALNTQRGYRDTLALLLTWTSRKWTRCWPPPMAKRPKGAATKPYDC